MIPIFPVLPDRRGTKVAAPERLMMSDGVVLRTLPPLSLYIHIPWCVRKCPYCDFNSHESADGIGELPQSKYRDALRADIERALPLVWGRKIHTVFFGGGTPSLFSAESIDGILSDIRALLPLSADAEVTLEANPGAFEAARFKGYRDAGVNRISIGIQSFNADFLRALGRIHDDHQAHRAAQQAGEIFGNFNLDLMYGLPGQSVADSIRDIDQALVHAAPHLSLYHLTIESNTVFAKHPPVLPDDDLTSQMQQMIENRLERAGYGHYEVSAFARDQFRCKHNLNYWSFGDYLGIGAGAHSKISFPDRVLRQERFRNPVSYMNHALTGTPVSAEHAVPINDLPFEFMLNVLRMTDGIPLARFAERTGLNLVAVSEPIRIAQARGLLEVDSLQLRPTTLGRRFLNDLMEIFLPSEHGENAPK